MPHFGVSQQQRAAGEPADRYAAVASKPVAVPTASWAPSGDFLNYICAPLLATDEHVPGKGGCSLLLLHNLITVRARS